MRTFALGNEAIIWYFPPRAASSLWRNALPGNPPRVESDFYFVGERLLVIQVGSGKEAKSVSSCGIKVGMTFVTVLNTSSRSTSS